MQRLRPGGFRARIRTEIGTAVGPTSPAWKLAEAPLNGAREGAKSKEDIARKLRAAKRGVPAAAFVSLAASAAEQRQPQTSTAASAVKLAAEACAAASAAAPAAEQRQPETSTTTSTAKPVAESCAAASAADDAAEHGAHIAAADDAPGTSVEDDDAPGISQPTKMIFHVHKLDGSCG